jgi:hypothetical protein
MTQNLLKAGFLSAFLLLGTSFSLLAAETPAAGKAELGPAAIDIYLAKVDRKFDRAAVNFTAGWTEIVNQPKQWMQKEDKNKALSAVAGVGHGLAFALADTVGGFFNALTAPLPQFEIPLPQDGIQGPEITGGNPVGKLPEEPVFSEDSY